MATITLNIPDAQASRVLDACCMRWGYQQTLANGTANPQTKKDFVIAKLAEYIKNTVKEQEGAAAAAAAQTTAVASADQISIT